MKVEKEIQDKELNQFDPNVQTEDELYLKMSVIQELRVILLNLGGIMQDIIIETYEQYRHYIHIYYVPF